MNAAARTALVVSALLPVGLRLGHGGDARAADAADSAAPPPAVEFRFTPTGRAQIAVWIEKPDGTFMGTVRLTQAVALHGIGNRPGASQMNSGFRWPYGRRVDVLPLWAHRRALAPGAAQFKPVIFQHRTSEGCASNAGCGGSDSSPESYFCLSFMQALTPELRRQQALDAVTCASVFNSDKGRYLTAADLAKGYAEPVQMGNAGIMRPLESTSLYPPRRDGVGCANQTTDCIDHPDTASYVTDVRIVMPDIDAITMATPPADQELSILFTVPPDWTDTDYVAWMEINVEGDYNATYNADTYATPQLPAGAWDSWAISSGYSYRGQPSVVYRVPFSLNATGSFKTAVPAGYGSVDGFGDGGGQLHAMDGTITDNLTSAATTGSGADRLRLIAPSDRRLQVNVRDVVSCRTTNPPQVPRDMTAVDYNGDGRDKHTHEWGTLSFVVPHSDRPIDHYDVRYSLTAITAADPTTFDHALPVLANSTDSVALTVPTDGAPGDVVTRYFGGMQPVTEYWIAVRAVDICNAAGPYSVASLTTTRINFTKLSGCFVATAAYGSPMEPEVEALRTVRDFLRPRSTLFAVVADLYYRSGPVAAALIARSDVARAVVRSVMAPVVDVALGAAPSISR